jgi:hypothetical protein
MFEVDGKIPDGLLEVGNSLPLTDQEGNRFNGMVAWVGLDKVASCRLRAGRPEFYRLLQTCFSFHYLGQSGRII